MSTTGTIAVRHPFERHALVVLGLSLGLMLVVVVLLAPTGVDPTVLLLSAVPSIVLFGAVVWALAVGRWWAAAAAVGMFAGVIGQGILEAIIALVSGSITIPLATILCAIVLWVDRPRPVGRGVDVAWIAAALYAGVYLFGFVVSRLAIEAAR